MDGSSRIITPKDPADCLEEIQSPQRKFHLSLIYFGLQELRKNDSLSYCDFLNRYPTNRREFLARESIRSRRENQPSALDRSIGGLIYAEYSSQARSERRVLWCTSVPRCGHTYE